MHGAGHRLAPRTDRAQDRAVGLAREWSAKLTFVNAIDIAEVPSDEAKEPAADIARRRAYRLLQAEVRSVRDLTPSIVIAQGDAANVVLETAQVEGADMIIAGTAGIGPLGRSRLPSSATWVIGFLVGIKMIMAGWSFIAPALGSHEHHHSTRMRPA